MYTNSFTCSTFSPSRIIPHSVVPAHRRRRGYLVVGIQEAFDRPDSSSITNGIYIYMEPVSDTAERGPVFASHVHLNAKAH
ncbi:hypothetical protein EVAR_89337_1 [Eumeta japonica]|uniref:Uncharacterized protein n=1 Tax=Eumeta variegata TaxID=151549 RepID=A0A4C1Y4C2_EUMVA|nr:hypothetical protein EVAR_89337_1 [Eumeta japonica]